MDAPVSGRPCSCSVRMRRTGLETRWATAKTWVHPRRPGPNLPASDCWPLHFRRRSRCPTALRWSNCWSPKLFSSRCSNFPPFCCFFFFRLTATSARKFKQKSPKQKSVQKRNQKIEKKKIISSASHKDGRPSLYSRVLSSKTTAREITCTNILA